MAQVTSPEHTKTQLNSLLTQILESEDPVQMDQFYHMIVDQSNQLRSMYGLPARVEDTKIHSVLKTQTQQLHLMGVGSESVCGNAVFVRASAKKPSRDICMFDECFVNKAKAEEFKKKCTSAVRRHMGSSAVNMLPPLLLRSGETKTLQFHVDEHGSVTVPRGSLKTNMLLVMFAEGPIVPVVTRDGHERFKSVIRTIYALQGLTDASALSTTLTTF